MTFSPRLRDLVTLLPLSELLSVVSFLFALVFLAHILRSKRPPQSTIAWVLTILLIPYLGVLIYITFGGRKMRRLAGSKEPIYRPHEDPATPALGTGTERILRTFGVPSSTFGNDVVFLSDGVEAFQALVEIIDSAKSFIHITTYILAEDATGKEIVSRLSRRAREGVKVRLLIDDAGSWRLRRRVIEPLVRAGGEVAFFMPVFHLPFRGRSNLRNHRKVVVADGLRALTGGMNLAEEYMGPNSNPNRWKDISLRVEGPAVRELDTLFRSDWRFTTRKVTETPQAYPDVDASSVTPHGGTPVQVVASGPDVSGDPLYESIVNLVFAARERIWVATPYFVPDEILARALELAARRGVDVRLLVPNRSNHITADLARFGYLRQVHDAGAKIMRYRPGMMHAKAILIDDDLALIGSANMDMRSLFLNYEVALFLFSPPRVYEVDVWFRTLFPKCRPGLNKQTWYRELAENVVRLVSPLL